MHGRLQRRDIDCRRYGATALALVTTSSWHVEAQVVVVLVEIQVGSRGEVVGLRGRALDEGRRHGSGGGGDSKVIVVVSQTILERLQRHQLGQLDTQDLGMASQVVHHDLACLLLLGEITALVEASGVGGIHVEEWRTVKFHHQTPRSRRSAIRPGIRVSGFQSDVLDVRERILDFVTSGIVVDIVGHAGLVGRVEDDQVHGILANAPPGTDREGAAGKMRNDCNRILVSCSQGRWGRAAMVCSWR